MKINQLIALITAAAGDELAIWDADEANPQQRTKKITVQNFINSVVTIADLLKQTDVVNNLTSTSTTAPLSAAQGKALNDSKLNCTNVGTQTTNSTKSYNVPSNYRGMMSFDSNTQAALLMVSSTSTGSIAAYEIFKTSGLTFTTSANTITCAGSSGSTTMRVDEMPFNNLHITQNT